MSVEMLKAGLMELGKPISYGCIFQKYLVERSDDDIRSDILNLISQERKEAVEEFLAKELDVRNFCAVPAVDPQKQRLDEFTKAALSCLSNKDWNDKKNIAMDAVQIARATIAELDK